LAASLCSKKCPFFGESNFALCDEEGRFLDVIPSQRWAAPDKKTMEVTNSFEFLNGSTKMKSLTLIPLASNLLRQNGSFSPVMATASLDSVPFRLQQNELGAVVVDKIDLSAQELTITYHADGILDYVDFFLLDQNDRELKDLKLAAVKKVDRQTGQHICTYIFTNHPSAAEIAQIKRIGSCTYDLQLRTEEQIVIPLR